MWLVSLLSGPEDAFLLILAERRELKFADGTSLRTPILVPSFSSRIPKIEKIFRASEEFIDGPILISAYDIKHKYLSPPFDFGNAIFLDSGGYEASSDSDLSDVSGQAAKGGEWSEGEHSEVLTNWASKVPVIVISYDHPKLRCALSRQIASAAELALPKNALKEILLKPETDDQHFVQVESVRRNVHSLSKFDVIGVTEKEMGNSVLERMENIATLRLALNKAGIGSPIHVFGSLDTITTLFYFVAGADIFDGLTWLRYAFKDGRTLYRQDFGITDLGIAAKFPRVEALCWSRNYQYMKEMEMEMRRFLKANDFKVFKNHGERLKAAFQSIEEEVRI
jgi:hypothetical protein